MHTATGLLVSSAALPNGPEPGGHSRATCPTHGRACAATGLALFHIPPHNRLTAIFVHRCLRTRPHPEQVVLNRPAFRLNHVTPGAQGVRSKRARSSCILRRGSPISPLEAT